MSTSIVTVAYNLTVIQKVGGGDSERHPAICDQAINNDRTRQQVGPEGLYWCNKVVTRGQTCQFYINLMRWHHYCRNCRRS
eukprot:2490854-Amphidinium_carterae.1